ASVATFALGVAVGHQGALVGPQTELATRAEPRVQPVPGAQVPSKQQALEAEPTALEDANPTLDPVPRGVERERNGGWAAPAKELLTAPPDDEPVDTSLEPSESVAEPASTAVHPPSW